GVSLASCKNKAAGSPGDGREEGQPILMTLALFRQATGARYLCLTTASGLALTANPALAHEGDDPAVQVHASPPDVQTLPETPPPGEPDLQTPDVSPVPVDAPKVEDENQIGFAADNLNYDSETEIVVAEGNVEMNREAISMRADKVTWNRKTGEVIA